MSEIILEHVTKIYPNGVAAVRDFSLTVAPGEMVTLVGPSGCGKTTTLRLIAGLEQPTSGSIQLAGRPANALAPRDRNVALVFQKHNVYPHLTVRANLAFGLRLAHPAGRLTRWLARLRPGRLADLRRWDQVIADRVSEAAAILRLEGVLDRLPAQLSGGQQQRVALGRALVRRPAVWLLDEPLSNLDISLRAELRRQLHLLHRQVKATMIYVTHDQLEAMTLGQRLVVMSEGIVQQVGPPEEVYGRPRNRLVAGFIGWPPMNFVAGRLQNGEGRLWFTADGRRLPLPGERFRTGRLSDGQAVTLGIRPEHLEVPAREGTEAALAMQLTLVEPLGGDALATFQDGAWRVTARVDRRQVDADGQTIEVGFPMSEAHLFDDATGLTLGTGGPAG
jgi:multiple sugar transport system ATP-binding protein